ncbi:sodium:solute symporter family protein [Orrella marina]|uniref:Cation acetate symporter n=1 Tax=Orrella marina TaxID=2163011 RepID=A0A2R4XK10_9BURK|nr:cation acetate symporter [Orrella marina]
MSDSQHYQTWRAGLIRAYAFYAFGFIVLIGVLAAFETLGLAREWIGYIFLLVTVLMYATIGIVCRTSDPVEYYVAGRRVPAVFNGMATAADWMSVASFIGVAGSLYFAGYEGLAYILGWTGGYVLLALFIAPYLRKFGHYTVPDFLGARYEGDLPRLIGVLCTLACSFTYLVAQIYGVGLITTRLTGITFELGVFIALGSMLICSFLGGMRAVTWTQVGQYIILVLAYLVPVVWLSISETGKVVPHVGAGQLMPELIEKQNQINNDSSEMSLRAYWGSQEQLMQMRLDALPESWQAERENLRLHLVRARASDAPMLEIRRLERSLANYPETSKAALEQWSTQRDMYASRAAAPKADHLPFDYDDPEKAVQARNNFLALLVCLMLGTAGLPHILARSLTTQSVSATRQSVFWSLLFILVLYLTAPALAVLVKNQIYQNVVGLSYSGLPDWISAWGALDRSLIDLVDLNGDGIVQLGEIHLGTDMVVLAGPEIGGMPVVLSGLVAAGAMAAALSTADGLLLTISNALSHDTSFRIVSPAMNSTRQVIMSKVFLLGVAFAAAWVATRTPADIIFMVTAAFSFAAASFFPALVLGIFWKRTNYWGVSTGMLAGIAMTFYYMALTQPWLREICFDVPRSAPVDLWFGIQPNAAGLFGIPLAFAVMFVISLLTPAPGQRASAMVDFLRRPE